jgi:hypothetical protein
MEEFDIQIDMNGVENELNSNLIDVSQKVNRYNEFEGEPNDVPIEAKKSWTETLDNLTQKFKDLTSYKTNEQVQAEREKELAEKGEKYKVLGMNPIVAIALSFVIIIVGSVAITKIKAK